jgi:hypothetical protein
MWAKNGNQIELITSDEETSMDVSNYGKNQSLIEQK